jgi:sigma-B regulation protein RsbU (phosphoserine phosphatase)
LSHEFSSILDIDELLTKIALTVRALINFDAFTIFLVEEDRKMLTCRFTQRYDKTPTAENIELGKGITGAAGESRQIIRVPNVKEDPRYIATDSDILSEIAVPLIVRDRVIGVMDLESVRLGFFTEDHARALSLLAPQIATSVENARLYAELAQREQRMEEDLGAARKLQSVLLPRTFSNVRSLDAAIQSRPAREVSGDVYDLFEHTENFSIIAFGDVSGKGAAAALFGALISGLLRILAPRQRAPAALMTALNDELLERKVDTQYATLCLALWEAPKRTFTICNAGALPPLVCRNTEIIEIRAEGVPIGLLEHRDYEQVPIRVERGDLVLFYSDGVEDQLSDHHEYGRERLQKLISKNYSKTPGEIARAVFSDIDEFRGGTPLTDDQTVIALRVL